MSDVKKFCKSCQWYRHGRTRTDAGMVVLSFCQMPIGTNYERVMGPQGTCDKWAYSREGVHEG